MHFLIVHIVLARVGKLLHGPVISHPPHSEILLNTKFNFIFFLTSPGPFFWMLLNFVQGGSTEWGASLKGSVMDCHGVPTKIVGRMNGPALPVSCAIELQCSYVVKANILRDWLPRKAKEKLQRT